MARLFWTYRGIESSTASATAYKIRVTHVTYGGEGDLGLSLAVEMG